MVTWGQSGLATGTTAAHPDGSYVRTNCETKYIFPYTWKLCGLRDPLTFPVVGGSRIIAVFLLTRAIIS